MRPCIANRQCLDGLINQVTFARPRSLAAQGEVLISLRLANDTTLHTAITNFWTRNIRVSLVSLNTFARQPLNIIHVGGTVPTGCGLTNAFAPTCLLTVAHVRYGIARSVVLGRKFFFAQFVSLADCRTSSLSGQYSRELNGHYFREKFECFSPLALNLHETSSFNGFARGNILFSDVSDQ